MKLWHRDPAMWLTAASMVGMVIGAALAMIAVLAVAMLLFSFEKVMGV